MNIYQTSRGIECWLDENGYFEDMYVLDVTSNPFTLLVGYTTLGNFRAYSDHHIQPFRIIPNGIIEMSSLSILELSPRHCIEAMEQLETDAGIGIRLLTSPYFDIVAESFTIKKESLLMTKFEPWVNPSDMSAVFSSQEIPTPAFWKKIFKEHSCDIVFRYYGGGKKEPEELPQAHYSGYFIQSSELINDTIMGLFISFADINANTVSMCFEKRDDEITDPSHIAKLDHLWDILTNIVFNLPDVKVRSGNCEFAADQWNDFITLKNQC